MRVSSTTSNKTIGKEYRSYIMSYANDAPPYATIWLPNADIHVEWLNLF
jgi:hypothetical protein